MLTIWSWIPFFIPVITALVVAVVNADQPPTPEFETWDNGLSW